MPILPDESSPDRLDLLQQALLARPGFQVDITPAMSRAAVAVVFRPGCDLLFIRRSEREGDPWSGHMAFPGGRVDPVDSGPRAAAERETREEVGLDLDRHGQLIGRLDELITPKMAARRQIVVTPFVYRLDIDPPLDANHEVADVHWFALDRLFDGEGRGTRPLVWQGRHFTLPAVRLDGTEVWGLTLRVLDGLIERVRDVEGGDLRMDGNAARRVG